MFKRPALKTVAILLAFLACAGGVLFLTFFSPYGPRRDRPAESVQLTAQADDRAKHAARQKAAPEQTQAPAPQQEEPKPKIYDPDCKRPEDHSQADLCVQRRMAEAAEWQNWLNSIGLGALVATLLATGAAAVATWWTVWTMQDAAKRQLRAYVYVDEAKIVELSDPSKAAMKVIIKNAGQTPAYEVTHITARFTKALNDATAFPEIPENEMTGTKTVINPGGAFKIAIPFDYAAAQLAAIRNGEVDFYLFGTIRYLDAFKTCLSP